MGRQQNHWIRTVWMVIVTGVLVITVSPCSAADYFWAQKADMPTARWRHSTCVVDSQVYAIGGTTSEPNPALVWTVEAYDPTTDSWTEKADIPTGRALLSTSVADGKIYAIGGAIGPDLSTSTVEEYDPAIDTWTQKADLPTPRSGLATVAVDGKIYAIGGDRDMTWVGLKTVEAYDPATDTWVRKADMSRGVLMLRASVVNGKIYALGGRPDLKSRAYMQEYDPATDTWTQKSDMPVATSQMASAVLGNKIVVVGGWLWSRDYPYTTVQMYDPETDTWTIEGDAPFLRACCSASVVDDRVYVVGGTNRPHPCPATSTVYELTISAPPPDFSADGSVDIKDLLILIESWGQNDPVADIAPPFGDGVVDVLDLEFLMGYWRQEIDDPTLIAHWPLDEAEGMVAYDSAGVNDSALTGVPAWQTDSGQVNGALEFNGSTFVTTPLVVSPSEGPFSVLAWIKGGEPGQVIISQDSGSDWLAIDAESGSLMTAVAPPQSRHTTGPLVSDAIVTDGLWHRIALVWDGISRNLYVDGTLIAIDEQNSLVPCAGGLNIGCGATMTPTTFFTGLIDDVRIYNRAVRP